MNDRGLRSGNNFRYCPACGRELEPSETCECDRVMVPRGMPRDGYRATCPQFKSRSSYRGKHYLDCDGHKLCAESRRARDGFYAVYCCGAAEQYTKCPFMLKGANPNGLDAGGETPENGDRLV